MKSLIYWVFIPFLVVSMDVGRASEMASRFTIRLNGTAIPLVLDEASLKTRSVDIAVHFGNGAEATVSPALIVATKNRQILSELVAVAISIDAIPDLAAFRVVLTTGLEALKWSEALADDPRVRFIHPDFKFPLEARDVDPAMEPLFKDQWNLENTGQSGGTVGADIDLRTAWRVTTGRPDVVIGLLDLGFEQDHEDLKDAWFVNAKEIPGNKKDDDGNGLIDDVSGWNFSTNRSNLIYGQNSKHGTATSGIIGARLNGRGVTGICPECKILPIVVSGKASEDAAAIMYAVKMGVNVMSNSWGYKLNPPQTDLVSEALAYAAHQGRGGKGIPIIFAMHNAAVDDCRSPHPDISGHPDVIAVSSVDHNDVKISESAFGECIAFVAPSSGSTLHGIVTTDRAGGNGYNADGVNNYMDLSYHNGFWGTSAAAPQVAGLYALLLSHEPGLTLLEANQRMRKSAVKVNPASAKYDVKTGHSKIYGYGRVSASKLFKRDQNEY